MADDDNVISLPVGDARRALNQRESEIAALPVSSKPSYGLDVCRHSHSVVDERSRTVTCASCGVSLDPIAVLDEIARDFALPLRRVQEARRRVKELGESIEQLEREERNAKARVRTARRRALTFDMAAIDAAIAGQRSVGWRRPFEEMSPEEQARARAAIVPLIETYIAVLTESEERES